MYVECHIRSNPFVYDVIWTFKGQQLISNRSEGIIIANQSLVLQNIKRKSSGHYQCSGRNEVGIGLSNELFIRVQCKFLSLSLVLSLNKFLIYILYLFFPSVSCNYRNNEWNKQIADAPFCGKNQRNIYSLPTHSNPDGSPADLSVICNVEADPSDELSFKWIFNSSSINPFINNNWYGGGGGSNGMMIGGSTGHSSSSSSSQYMTEITSFTVNGTTSIARVSPSFASSPSSAQVSSVTSFDKKEGKRVGSSSRIGDESNNNNEPGSSNSGRGGGSNRIVSSPSSSLPSVYGSILCWAENSAGQQKDPCVYYLLPVGKLR